MKRILALLPVFLLFVAIKSHASTTVYLLGFGGAGIGSTEVIGDVGSTDVSPFGFGVLLGYQVSTLFAVEIGYKKSILTGFALDIGGYESTYSLSQDDYKANFLLHYHIGTRFLGVIPYAGAGLILSNRNQNLSLDGETFRDGEFDFGFSFKAGVRAKLSVVMVGAFVEYDLRFNTTKNVYAGVELGFGY